LNGRIGAAFHAVGSRTDVGAYVPGNTVASIYVPASSNTSDQVYFDGRAVTATLERGYLRVDGVAAGCHAEHGAGQGAPQGRAPHDRLPEG